ncbi:MAG: RHS repeat-associated core domain-containing protein, partial [Oscillospiraceae bacterium]|nr:RHS repeat-associated core domain-containing protein [Oscillospiraceae bacterium]
SAYGEIISITDANGTAITSSTHVANRNHLRYRGYYYDSETGFYYLQSRYYDPVIGRFINADGQLNMSQGVLGANMYIYCLNNPINTVDYGGNKPGDLFDTVDEAAIDFAMCYNNASITDKVEYATSIYKVTTIVSKKAITPPTSWYLLIFGINT